MIFCVGFWLLLLLILQNMASLPLRSGGHIVCCIRWMCHTCTGYMEGIDVRCYMKEGDRSKTWFCTWLPKCTPISARDGCDGESYPRIIMMATVDDGLLSFFLAHSHNESIVLVTCITIVLSIYSCFCFCLWCNFSFGWMEEVRGYFTVQLVPYCLVQGVVYFCSCSALWPRIRCH